MHLQEQTVNNLRKMDGIFLNYAVRTNDIEKPGRERERYIFPHRATGICIKLYFRALFSAPVCY